MDVRVTVIYSTDNIEVNEAIEAILDNTLPYMVDNVEVHFEVEE
jgi:hypothetical protein